MTVDDLIREYYQTTDNDLRYMALKTPMDIIRTDDDLTLLLNKLVFPILSGESFSDIVNLLSFELLPQWSTTLFKKFDNRAQLIYLPFIRQCLHNDSKQTIFLQSLRNILQNVETDTEWNCDVALSDDSIIFEFLEIIKMNNFYQTQSQLCKETLNILIKLCYDTDVRALRTEILVKVLAICSEEDHNDINSEAFTFSPITETLLCNSCRLTNSTNLAEALSYISDNELEVISKYWFQFNRAPQVVLKIAGNLSADSKTLERDLTIVKNFRKFYLMNCFSSKAPVINQNEAFELVKALINLHQSLKHTTLSKTTSVDATDATSDNLHMGQFENADDDEEDVDQREYLDQLLNEDDAELHFEEETDDEATNDYATRSIKIIEDILGDISVDQIDRAALGMLERPELELLFLSADQPAPAGRESEYIPIAERLTSSQELAELQKNMNCMEQQLRDENFPNAIERSHLVNSVLRHLQRNKQFVKIIKVGNMKQKIDEGLNLRTVSYSVLFQVPEFSYDETCMIIEAIVEFGLREKEESIQKRITALFQKILAPHFYNIQGLDQGWFNENVRNTIYMKSRASPDDAKSQVFLDNLYYLTFSANHHIPNQ
ncbi:Lag2p KNAG_0I01630 [Huiozyma naganishii CBS 8797]|uniref:TATA-binding protein interacting (TIP20) domain-containing protein n=1 Tax=Huiozyma naganishii (strain ATCC MYA-139 / BCRC 22969 / CBS 8797 / KCTC 17520 / NBRC 10181 / NCYC 3082 / Yp74L-3) TaxID=1071383 RepID=J7S971_HUIN7|nr:hypothetical protein KNAG_0I01630 [Kazachstania naganishii CBS 8797]CCK71949.1 hypothetical protein KNAG_0I01630 [Kazachstania naganishii CBS 8797]